jgi:hypothetical protein
MGQQLLDLPLRELTGLTDLPAGGHYVAAPYATGRRWTPRRCPRHAASESTNDFELGADLADAQRQQRARRHPQPDFAGGVDAGQIGTNNPSSSSSREAAVFPEGSTSRHR